MTYKYAKSVIKTSRNETECYVAQKIIEKYEAQKRADKVKRDERRENRPYKSWKKIATTYITRCLKCEAEMNWYDDENQWTCPQCGSWE